MTSENGTRFMNLLKQIKCQISLKFTIGVLKIAILGCHIPILKESGLSQEHMCTHIYQITESKQHKEGFLT
jgi:hypothetical protein